MIATLSLGAVVASADESGPKAGSGDAPGAEPKSGAESEPVATEGVDPAGSRWIPSLDLGYEVFDYNVDVTVQNFVNGPAWAGTQKEASRQDMFRIGGELMAPAFEDLPGQPRFFAKGGAQIRMFSSDELYDVGDAGVFSEPEIDVIMYGRQGNFKGENLPMDFIGQGSDVFGSFEDPSWYAAFGVAFSVPISTDLLLQIKPSVVYSFERIDLAARLTTVGEINPHEDPDSTTPTRNFFIERSREAVSTEDHSVGAGLELSMVLFRNLRPVRVSLYSEARFLWVVSGTSTRFGDPGSVASFSVERDGFGIKGGGGFRISWVGFD